MTNPSKYFESLAMAVASGSTIRAASGSASCSESQAYRICATTEFRLRVAKIRSEITSQAVGIITEGATKASATLVELLSQANEPSVRLNAAKAILLQLGPLSELGELRARIDRIEAGQLRVHRA